MPPNESGTRNPCEKPSNAIAGSLNCVPTGSSCCTTDKSVSSTALLTCSSAPMSRSHRRENALGNPLEKLIVPTQVTERYLPGLADYLINGVGSLIGRPVEVIARRNSGEQFPIELALTQILDSDPAFFTAFIRDITERK